MNTINMPEILPKRFFDTHHHFVDTASHGDLFQHFVGQLIPNTTYLQEDYRRDVVDPIEKASVNLLGSVHMECIPDDGVQDAQWVSGMIQNGPSQLRQGHCGVLSCSTRKCQERTFHVIQNTKCQGHSLDMDCVGKFDGGKSPTQHVATKGHNDICYLRESNGGYNGQAVPEFETGFALLQKYNLIFDLQCAPVQLPAASCARSMPESRW
jgi:predicted TIM-barrel fold metal-dependent hydrolase